MNLKNRNIITISIFERIEFTMNKDIISIDIDSRGFKSILESMPGAFLIYSADENEEIINGIWKSLQGRTSWRGRHYDK